MRRLALTLSAATLSLAAALCPAAAADFKLEKTFAGTTLAEGRFRAINGVSRAFKVKLTGSWNGKRLKLIEDFAYADGERDRKTWYFTKTGKDSYSGTREDVVGPALVTVKGNVATYSYNVYLDSEKRKNRVRFHDTMVLRKDGSVLNTALVTKFGLPVARTRVEFRKP